jgi:GMP reductase
MVLLYFSSIMQQFLLNYQDIILRHKKSVVFSRSECNITSKLGPKTFDAPVCCSNMKSILTPNICKVFDDRNWFYVYHRIDGIKDVESFIDHAQTCWNLETDSKMKWNTISISIGIGNEWIQALQQWATNEWRIDYITIDVALSYNDNIIPTINAIKKYYPNAYLIVGNGCIPEWITWLEGLGVNCAKIGIGVSKSCRTRQYTGFGSTTVSDLIECVNVAKEIDIMSDGGLTVDNNGEVWIGDINKALVLGSNFVMTGAAFSKCIDSQSVVNGYFGNASVAAKGNRNHIEGTNVQLVTNGLTINQMCDLIEDSIKSGTSYAGGTNLSAFNSVEWNLIRN